MSFEVKVTYLRNGETRKFKTDSTSFPSFAHLYNQLYNIFHLSHDFYLSKLLFSPNASERGRILIGKDVRSSEEYDACVVPYLGQHFGNALLRITVSDDPPRNFSRLLQGRGSAAIAVNRMNQRNHNIPGPYTVAATYVPPVSFAHIPPPPTILPQMPLTHVPSVSSTPHEDRSSTLPSSSPVAQQQHAHTQCCDASRVKADVHALISSFKEDLNGVLVKAYGHSQLEGWTPNYQGAVIPPAVPAFSPAQTPKLEFRMNPSCITCLRQPTGCFLKCHVCSASKCSSCADLPEPLQCTGPFGHAWETTFTSEGSSDAAPNFDFVPSSTLLGPEDQSVLADWPISNFPAADSDAAPIGRPVAPVLPEPTSAPQAIPEPPVSMNHPTAPVHANVTCDICDSVVVGTRHKCLDCPDYDLCQSCIDQGGAQRHQPFHEFIDIKEPGRVIVHTVFDNARRMPARSTPQASEPAPAPAPSTHRANCDLCESRIVGDRYKCLNCPDFDTCQSCFAITKEQHPGHGFVKIKDPQDYIGRAIPKLRHNAICDSCNKIIYGVRYKCMHADCPDYDLCDGCEAHPISQHNPKHPMLKMRSPSVVVPRLNSVPDTSRPSAGPTVVASSTVPAKEDVAEVKEQAEPSVVPAPFTISVEQPAIARASSPEIKDQEKTTPVEKEQEKTTTAIPELDSPDMDTFSILTRAPTLLSQMLQQERERLSHLIGLAERVTPESMGFFDVFATSDVPRPLMKAAAAVDVPMVKATSTSDASVMKDTAESDSPVVDAVAESTEAAVPSGSGPSVTDQVPESSKEVSVGNLQPIPQAGADIVELSAQASTTTETVDFRVELEALSSPSIVFEEVLDAACVQDVTIKHGQKFPPGAEFVKVWKLRNSGSVPWPASTEIALEGGEPLGQDGPAFVGTVPPGGSVDVWTGGLKAPDAAGRYVGYWRLRDGSSKVPFGDLVWVDVTVEEANNSDGDALSSSSIIVMPQSAGVGSRHWSVRSKNTEDGSDDGSLSLISVPSSSSSALSDFAEFTPTSEAAARSAMDYVVLYDEVSSNSGEDYGRIRCGRVLESVVR